MVGISITLRNLKDFSGGSVVKNLPANAGDAGDMDSIPGLRRSPGEGNATQISPIADSLPSEPPGKPHTCVEVGGKWETSVVSTQVFCEPKTALKYEVY